ncbi:MAG: phosphotransferase [Deltaproteobacteria bacterium]|nr:phosphotransferase [Deltaproteobacteria bacterium]
MKVKNELDDWQVFARQALELPVDTDLHIEPITPSGSTRTYFRVFYHRDPMGSRLHEREGPLSYTGPGTAHDQNVNCSAIFTVYDKNIKENDYYVPIAEFLRKIDIPAPKIIYHHFDKGYILMEDLGEADLWSFRDEGWDVRRDYYFKTLEILQKLHSFPLDDFPADQVSLMEGFGPELYGWERNYFLENFINNYCRINLDAATMEKLEIELAGLADNLEKQGKCLVHRDFQSKNVMIHDNKPVLIDFQGMRTGSLFYDLGSLLYDPYVVFDEKERLEMLRYYYSLAAGDRGWPDFQESFRLASAQRLMQALGAYGYLGLKLNKTDFLRHIPNGFRNLLDAAIRSERLPQLEILCRRCLTVLSPL